MGITSNTGLSASIQNTDHFTNKAPTIELKCDVSRAPFLLRPYAGLYNPFSRGCSILCNHPADIEGREVVKRAKDAWERSNIEEQASLDVMCGICPSVIHGKPRISSWHVNPIIGTSEIGTGTCLTGLRIIKLLNGDIYRQNTDKNTENKLGVSPEEIAALQASLTTLDREILKPAHEIPEEMFRRYTDTDSRPLTPAPTLASGKSRGSRRCLTPDQTPQRTAIVLDLRRSHSQETIYFHGYTPSDITSGFGVSSQNDKSTAPSTAVGDVQRKSNCQQMPPLASPLILSKRAMPQPKELTSNRSARKSQLKALKINKDVRGDKIKTQVEITPPPLLHEDVSEYEGSVVGVDDEVRRRGRRRRKSRPVTSAALTHTHQDPETQIAGISTDSRNASSRASIATEAGDAGLPTLPGLRDNNSGRPTESFLHQDILKYLHREVDEAAIETEFDSKRRYVLEEALRTRPSRVPGDELSALLMESQVPSVCLASWLHIPRIFSRNNARFSLPLDSKTLEKLTPMSYAAQYVSFKKSKQLLYLTVLQTFRSESYQMPLANISQGLIAMMGGSFTEHQAVQFQALMEYDSYEEHDTNSIIKCPLKNSDLLNEECDVNVNGNEQNSELDIKTINFQTWCGICAICERMYGRYPPREKDPPDRIELNDFFMLETKMTKLKISKKLREVLNAIRTL